MRKLALQLAIAYGMLLLVLTALQDRLIFFPERGGKVSGPGIDLELRARDGARLHARYIERAGAPYTLLYLHGNAGNLAGRSGLLQQLSEFGVSVLALEYRGYGQSEGSEPSEVGLYSDAQAAYEWAVAKTPASNLVLWGESLGGGPACELASTQPVGGVVLQSTFTSIADMAALSFPWLPVRMLVRTRFDNLSKIQRIQVPKLFLHSRHDEVVPFDMGQRLFAAAPEPKDALWLERSGHNDMLYSDGEEVAARVATFLQTLAGTR